MITLKMMLMAVAFFLLFGPSQVSAQEASGMKFFQGTLKEAVAKAKAENKYIFFDAYASWCGPCKAMERDVFTDKTVASYMNEKFISIRIDMEKGEGPTLAKRFTSIDGYPSMLFLDKEGHVIKTLLGSRDAEAFLAESRLVAK